MIRPKNFNNSKICIIRNANTSWIVQKSWRKQEISSELVDQLMYTLIVLKGFTRTRATIEMSGVRF